MALTFSHKHIKKCKMVHTEHVRNAGKRSWTLHVTGQSEREKRGRNRDRRGKKKKRIRMGPELLRGSCERGKDSATWKAA